MRHFFGIGLYKPKHPENIGGALRSAYTFGASFVQLYESKFTPHPANTPEAQRHIPVFEDCETSCVNSIHDCEIVLVDGPNWLFENPNTIKKLTPKYEHPKRALYIFGNESKGIPLSFCAKIDSPVHQLIIPTEKEQSINLAASVAVVLADRYAKSIDQ